MKRIASWSNLSNHCFNDVVAIVKGDPIEAIAGMDIPTLDRRWAGNPTFRTRLLDTAVRNIPLGTFLVK
jgi:hypothetical protein